ncbi:MAG: FtsX-like permease family protein, partial [Muribaculaceae bacterium]|nr:FtsX-like permease family protein [Muribaculaceae bacterium]
NIAENFEQVDTLFTGIDLLALFIGLSTLLAGVIGIGNIMWVIVKERTQEIGIRRAIGAKPVDIIVQVLCEGAVLTVVSGLAGLSLAALILGVMQYLNNPADAVSPAYFQMSFTTALGILATFVALGLLAGLIPSIKAMRIKPVEAINSK